MPQFQPVWKVHVTRRRPQHYHYPEQDIVAFDVWAPDDCWRPLTEGSWEDEGSSAGGELGSSALPAVAQRPRICRLTDNNQRASS